MDFGLEIQQTLHANSRSVEHMRVNHRCGHVFVTTQLLHGADIIGVLKQIGCEEMSKRMTACRLINSAVRTALLTTC